MKLFLNESYKEDCENKINYKNWIRKEKQEKVSIVDPTSDDLVISDLIDEEKIKHNVTLLGIKEENNVKRLVKIIETMSTNSSQP